MRKLRFGGVLAALVVGLGAAVTLAADRTGKDRDARPEAESGSRWDWINPTKWFGSKGKATSAKDKKDAKKDSARTSDPAPRPTPVVDEAVARRNREEADFLRRMEVLDRLREVALRSDDQALLRRADQLSERAWAMYSQRTGSAAVGSFGLDADLKALDKHLELDAPIRRTSSPTQTYSITGERRAGVKEVER